MIFVYAILALGLVAVFLFSLLAIQVGRARRAPKKRVCAYCGSAALRLSAPNALTDGLLAYWNCVPYRCEVCFRRQYRLEAGNSTIA